MFTGEVAVYSTFFRLFQPIPILILVLLSYFCCTTRDILMEIPLNVDTSRINKAAITWFNCYHFDSYFYSSDHLFTVRTVITYYNMTCVVHISPHWAEELSWGIVLDALGILSWELLLLCMNNSLGYCSYTAASAWKLPLLCREINPGNCPRCPGELG